MYEFNEKRHIHTLDGKPLMGVTTVLSVISKPALIQWSANMACDYISSHSFGGDDGGNYVKISPKDIKEARTAHRKKKEKAGDWGTAVHKAIETTIKTLIDENEGYCHETVLEAIDETNKQFTDFDDTQKKVVRKFFEWAVENKVTFLESEKHLWSKEMWVGGIVDLVFEMDGNKYVGDIKTSSGIYNEAFFQMGAYHLMLEEMGVKDISGYIVINLKKDGEIDMKRADNLTINQEAFKHALGLYKIINSLK